MFGKILVANRGEIARRIFLACHELGVPCVAVYSEVDAAASWVRLADESYPLVGVTAAETYLDQEAVLAVVEACGADAIHPGYGFLSENADFAAACGERGLTFIGPEPEAIRLMGSKAAARELARRAGVPVVPGVDGAGKSEAELQAAAAEIGYPLLIKASAGGGGKGMRVVWSEVELAGALQAARSEARSAFGDSHVLLEKFFTHVHHVEIQVLGDRQGNLLHLFERECSIQRRHQKIIEESPAPVIGDDTLRQAIAEAAVALARAANYSNAGTVEFIVVDQSSEEDDRFYFLEMNTRLQVEHPVTELVTGLDLVTWQIRIAAGEPLPFGQENVGQRGHAIECRVYAEDPANDFMPSTGTLTYYRRPSGPGVRVDDGIESGAPVSPYYDPMLAKVITWGHDRDEARRKMVRALRDTIVLGITTNIPYLLDILQEPSFVAGQTTTIYLQERMASWQPEVEMSESEWLGLAAWEQLQQGSKLGMSRGGEDEESSGLDPWNQPEAWRNVKRKA